MKNFSLIPVWLFCLLYCSINGLSQNKVKSIEVGDKAPSLTIQEWIKGDSIVEFKKGQQYVVEFSGSWCPPCRKAIPHLTMLAKKYSNWVKVISVYNENNNADDLKDLSYLKNIRALISSMGNKMDFIIAADVPAQTTRETWGIRSWPSAFVLDSSGIIVWKGHPLDLEPVLEKMTTGTFDAATTIREADAFTGRLTQILEAKKKENYEGALYGLDSLMKEFPEKKWLYYTGFHLLAGYDDAGAYALLQRILDNSIQIEGFDWPHFVGSEFNNISPSNRNYEMELKALDRTIEESETKFHAAYPLSLKARTYGQMKRYKEAIEMCRQAIECSKATGGNKATTTEYENRLIIYRYQLKAEESITKANKWIKKMIASGKAIAEDSLINAIVQTGKSSYGLALDLIDNVLKENNSRPWWFLSTKAKIWADRGDYEKAIEICRQALELSKEKKIKYYTAEYEKKLVELKEKAAGAENRKQEASPPPLN